ncbi:APC family permease [Homoserinimonas aerilata]|nr:APC family permease [Homoserinimonas aerilata]
MGEVKRQLGVGGAVMVGLASMIGAGVFFAWAPAAEAAGGLLLVALLVAAVVAVLNALSTAQLAMAHPVSGGSYAYARATVGPWTGFAAGWLFLCGKTASAGAIALIAGSYLWPEQARLVAVVAVLVLASINAAGIRSTATVSTVIVVVVLAGLAVTLLMIAAQAVPQQLAPIVSAPSDAGPWGILQAAALLFFCFAGYARMATLGGEVRDPRRTLPRAIIAGLAVALVIYFVVGGTLMSVLGPQGLAGSVSPLADAVGGGSGWQLLIRVVAGVACLGSLAGILAGLSRTALAMADGGDLPGPLARVSERTHAPIVAEATLAVIAVAGILFLDPARLVGFSSCAVLAYYAIAHLSALRQPAGERWLPRTLQVLGVAGCLLLAFSLPLTAIVVTAAVLALGFALRALRQRRASRR